MFVIVSFIVSASRFLFLLELFLLTVSGSVLSAQIVVKEVLRFESPEENILQADRFRPYEKGFDMRDGVFVCDNGEDAEARRGVAQGVVLNQETPMPVFAEAWSKAENVGASPDSDYSLYLDIQYADGTFLWGQNAPFSTGTGEWERRNVVVIPEKPIQSLTFYALFRGKTGKASFRDLSLSTLSAGTGAVLFDGVPILKPEGAGKNPAARFQIRDVASNSDFVALDWSNFDVRSEIRTAPLGEPLHSGTEWTVRLKSETDEDRCLTLIHAVKIDLKDVRFCEMRRDVPVSEQRNREHLAPTSQYSLNNVGSNGRLSKFPISAVVGTKTDVPDASVGRCVGIDLAHPAFFRTGYNEATGELFVAVDLALTKEKPEATLRFVEFDFTPEQGLRGAWSVYQGLFSDFFRCRTPEQGVWMPFAKISGVRDFEDFGFRFKEGDNETAWDDEHGILTFRYTEPMTWWMALPDGTPRTYDAALKHAEKLAGDGNEWARALFVCGMCDADGRFAHRMLDTPWCNGAVWSFCDLPGIENGGFALKWNAEIAKKLYRTKKEDDSTEHDGLDGEYVDSSEGYVTAVLDCSRDHFSATKTPLVFSRDEFRPAIFRGLLAYEYVRALSEDVHGRGGLMMANSTPHALCWLAPYLDVMGTETNWNHDERWSPTSDEELLWRRFLIGPKPYCFLMNTRFEHWTFEMTEKFMKRSLAYGMFPGFFSADASTGHYFSRPELYDRDRPLFKKYVPICREVAQAGWQAVTRAVSSHEKVYVERFGEDPRKAFYTVLNDSGEERTVSIRFESENLPDRWTDRVESKTFEMKDNSITLTILPENVVVLVPN